MEGCNLSLISVNCRSANNKEERLTRLFRHRQCDFLLLQETRIKDLYCGNKFVFDMKLKHGFFSYDSGQDYNHIEGWGTGIIQTSDRWEVLDVLRLGGRLTGVTITDKTNTLMLITLYAPAKYQERRRFFEEVLEVLGNVRYEIILMGDFNITLEDRDILGTSMGKNHYGRVELQHLVDHLRLVDGYRLLFPYGHDMSFIHKTQDRKSRIDRIYIRQNRLITKHQYLDETVKDNWTDHSGLYVQIGGTNTQRHTCPHWKLNNSVLENEEYTRKVSEEIQAYTQIPPPHGHLNFWVNLKTNIRDFTKEFCKAENKRRRDRERELTLILEVAKSNPNLDPMNITAYEEELESIKKHKYTGAQIRSRVEFLEEPTKEFLAMEGLVQSKRNIGGVEDKNGVYVTEIGKIRETFLDYYSGLYDEGETDTDMQDVYLNYVRTIDDTQKTDLETDVTEQEILESIHSFSKNKSPGPDGLTAEFYQKFSRELAPLLRKVVEEIFERGEMPNLMNLSYIALLPKEENCRQTKQYRPISLLNTDYKVITKTLTNRLGKYMHILVHPDQASACKGRTIQDQNLLIRDTIAYAKQTNTHACVLSLDQVKAFDRVSHSFLFKVLEKCNLGPNFRKWIQILYKNPESKILINQTLTEAFKIKRSVRQGDSLSPLLYVLILEPLLEKIRQNPRIQGVIIPGGRKIIVLAFADDTNFFPRNRTSIDLIMLEFDSFGKASGSKINENKTQLLPLGSWNPPLDDPYANARVAEVKIFGIHYSNTVNQLPNDQLLDIEDKIDNVIKGYFYKSTSIFGRALIINTLGISKLNYVLSTLDLPKEYLGRIQNKFRLFLLKGTVHNVSNETLILGKLEGGVGVQDLKSRERAFRYKYILRIIENPDAYPFGIYYLGLTLRQHIQFNNTMPHAQGVIPTFYKNCISLIRQNPQIFVNKLTPKKAYTFFVNLKQQQMRHKQAIFTRIRHSTTHGIMDFTDTFKNIHIKELPNYDKQITWRIIFHNTPTKEGEAIKLRRIVPCMMCRQTIQECQEHIFWTCKGVRDCKNALRTFLAYPNRTPETLLKTHKAIFLNLLDPNPNKKHYLLKLILVSIYRYTVWTTRLKCCHSGTSYSSLDILNRYLALVRYRLEKLGLWTDLQRMAGE